MSGRYEWAVRLSSEGITQARTKSGPFCNHHWDNFTDLEKVEPEKTWEEKMTEFCRKSLADPGWYIRLGEIILEEVDRRIREAK